MSKPIDLSKEVSFGAVDQRLDHNLRNANSSHKRIIANKQIAMRPELPRSRNLVHLPILSQDELDQFSKPGNQQDANATSAKIHEEEGQNRNTEPQQESNGESVSEFQSAKSLIKTEIMSIVLEQDAWKKTVILANATKADEQQTLDKSLQKASRFEVHGKVVFYDERSLFCLHSSYTIRKKLVWLVEWRWFENFVTAIILANSVTLALNDYQDRLEDNYQSKRNAILNILDQVFTAIFLVECFCKITAMGFILHKKAYLRELWNWLDFFVVSISVIALIPGIETNSSLKAIRTLRIVRPLRSINAMPRMRALIQSLIKSLPGLANVFVFLCFAFSIFAIFGMHQFIGFQYQRCRMTDAPILDSNGDLVGWPIDWSIDRLCKKDSQCEEWLGPDAVHKCGSLQDFGYPTDSDLPEDQQLINYNIVNFDNMILSLLSVFQVLTLEGWTAMMYNAMDSNEPAIAVLFYCTLVIFGAFFTMNLVLAQIMESFQKNHVVDAMKPNDDKGNDTKNEVSPKNPENVESQNNAPKDDVQISPRQTQAVTAGITHNDYQSYKTGKDSARKATLLNVPDESNEKRDGLVQMDQANQIVKDSNTLKASTKPEEVPKDTASRVADQFEDEEDYEYQARKRAEQNAIYKFMYLLVTSTIFNVIIFCLIIGNTITLALNDYPQSDQKELRLEYCNVFFTWVFFVEMIMKMGGFGIKNYARDKFNLFDACVVVLSLIDWTISKSLSEQDIGAAGDALQAFRAMRLLRVIKLARLWKELQEILTKTLKSLRDISSFSILLILFMYIYALLGMELFANRIFVDHSGNLVKDPPAQYRENGMLDLKPPRANFDDILAAMITIFIIIVGDDWQNVMYNGARLSGKSVSIYFISCMVIGNIILLSLFTAILLQNFEEKEEEKERNMIEHDSPADRKEPKPFNLREFKAKIFGKIKHEFLAAFGPHNRNRRATATMQKVVPEKDSSELEKSIAQDKPEQLAEPLTESERKLVTPTSEKQDSFVPHMHYQGMTKKTNDQTIAFGFDALSGKSLFVFSPENKLRVVLNRIYQNKWFERVIMSLIGISTIQLAFESPLDDPVGKKQNILNIIDYVMTSLFSLESCVKIISLGFFANGKKSYLRSPWNILDFIIVSASIISLSSTELDLSFIKSLRILRILRPLRLISRNQGLKLAITTLANSLPIILNLLVIMQFFIFLIGILTTTLFAGKMNYCQTDHLSISLEQAETIVKTKWDCLNLGGEWVRPDLNFDTVSQSMITLMTIQTTEGWAGVMWDSVDARGQEMQPVVSWNRAYILFFIFVMLFLCMLFLNLFVGVVIETFNNEKETLSCNHYLRHAERQWIEMQLLVYSAKPKVKTMMSGYWVRDSCIRISEHKAFDTFVMIVICLNTVVLAIKWFDQPLIVVTVIEYINYGFMGIFTLEAIIKIIALKKNYFRDGWNIFDFLVVIGTIIVLIFQFLNVGIDLGVQSTILRSLRIGRILRIVKRARKLQIIFQTLIDSLPALGSLGLLLMLLLFLYAIIGISQFSTVQLQDAMDEHTNFISFVNAFLLLMRSSTGEAWNELMFDSARPRSILFQCNPNQDYNSYVANDSKPDGCGSSNVAYLYYLSFQIIIKQVFINLFIAIIIDSFIQQSDADELPIKKVDIENFVDIWKHYDPEAVGFIHANKLEDLIIEMAKAQNSFVQNQKKILSNPSFRRRTIARLEIPTFKKFRCFMFYDVLLSFARMNFEVEFYREKIVQRKKLMKTDVEKIYNHQNLDNISVENVLMAIPNLDKRIELVRNLRSASDKIMRRFSQNVDRFITPQIGLYTSRHFVYGTFIVAAWRESLRWAQDEQSSPQMDIQPNRLKQKLQHGASCESNISSASSELTFQPRKKDHIIKPNATSQNKSILKEIVEEESFANTINRSLVKEPKMRSNFFIIDKSDAINKVVTVQDSFERSREKAINASPIEIVPDVNKTVGYFNSLSSSCKSELEDKRVAQNWILKGSESFDRNFQQQTVNRNSKIVMRKMISTQYDDCCSSFEAEKEVEDTVFHNDKKRMV